jgi:hypothetical protein
VSWLVVATGLLQFSQMLFPVVWAWCRGTTTRAVTPIFYHQHDSATGLNLNVLGPMYWAKSKGATYAGIAPIFFGQYGKDGTSKTILFPVEATQLIGTLGGIGELAKDALTSREGR